MPSLGVPSTWGLMLEEVAFTWKLIKQFHVRANQRGQHPNAETRILLTNVRSKRVVNELVFGFWSVVLCNSPKTKNQRPKATRKDKLRCVGVAAAFALK
jgi:hypothetical protein